jgi:hypothetical protein
MAHDVRLIDDLYALEEPWRTRFLILIAKLATGQPWNNHMPSRSTTEAWLAERAWLQRQIAQMLDTWVGERC